MNAGIRVSLVLAACLATALPLSAQAREGFGEKVDVKVVNVDVFVTGKDGKPATGLQKDDFAILEDGKPVEVSYFEEIDRGARPASVPAAAEPGAPSRTAAPAPADALQLVVYIDNLHIRAVHRARVLRQLREVLSGDLLRPGDRVMVVAFDHGLQIQQTFTADRAALARAIDGVEQMPARGDDLMLARRHALEQIFQILETARAISAATTQVFATPPAPGSFHPRHGPAGMGPDGTGNRDGNGEGDPNGKRGADVYAVQMDPICRNDVPEPARAYALATRQEVLASIGAIKALISSLSGLPGHKALLHVSDGLPLTPGEELFQALNVLCGGGGAADGGVGQLDSSGASNAGYRAESALLDAQSYSTAKDWTLLASHANTHRVTLYTLQASGLETLSASAADLGTDERYLQLTSVDSVEMQNRQGSLSVMAVDTGGRPIFNANDVRPDLARMRDDFDHYYSLGFTPRRPDEAGEHRLEVRLARRDLKVRHPRSYRDRSPLEMAADRTLAALFYGQVDNPLEVGLEIGEARPQERGTFNVPVQLKIPLHKLSFRDNQVDLEGKVRILVVTQGPHGEASRLRQVEVPLKIPRDKALVALGKDFLYELTLTLPAGGQRVAVAVRDEGTSLTSFLARDVQVGQEGSTR
ncbi:MAG TPA: VWA domain-containing protein [Thermoanaerobaculia bacterium]|nr:VWA domain-containing protein [Thermoanaerobaculia bacterium]